MRLWTRLKQTVLRRRLDRQLRDEMAIHRQMLEEQLRAQGMPEEEACLEALRRFGNSTIAMESSREQWGVEPLNRIGRDLRFAARRLMHNPSFAITAILMIALGGWG